MIRLTNSAAPSETHTHTHFYPTCRTITQLAGIILVSSTFIHYDGHASIRRHAYTRDVLGGGDGERL